MCKEVRLPLEKIRNTKFVADELEREIVNEKYNDVLGVEVFEAFKKVTEPGISKQSQFNVLCKEFGDLFSRKYAEYLTQKDINEKFYELRYRFLYAAGILDFHTFMAVMVRNKYENKWFNPEEYEIPVKDITGNIPISFFVADEIGRGKYATVLPDKRFTGIFSRLNAEYDNRKHTDDEFLIIYNFIRKYLFDTLTMYYGGMEGILVQEEILLTELAKRLSGERDI